MRVSLYSLLAVFLFASFYPDKAVKPALAGVYYALDTNAGRAFCKSHTLTLNADSTFTYYSMCLNSEGTWTYKNKKVVLTSKDLGFPWFSNKIIKHDDYSNEHDDIRVKVIGNNGKPIVCEEVRCVAQGKHYTQFTNKDGEAFFPVEKFDTVYFVSISDYYRDLWKKSPLKVKDNFYLHHIWFGFANAHTRFSVNNEYQHYAAFSGLEFETTKENMLLPNTGKQNEVVKLDLPQIPFGKKTKKK